MHDYWILQHLPEDLKTKLMSPIFDHVDVSPSQTVAVYVFIDGFKNSVLLKYFITRKDC